MNIKKLLKDILDVIVPSLVITYLLISFVFMPVQVQGTSMVSTLNPLDSGISFIFTKNLGIKRFDIVVIKTEEKLLVKRVIGMPNETLSYKDNKLYINGEYVQEDFLAEGIDTSDIKEIKLNSDEYYCLGDNREVSKDSRFYGAFLKENIKASHIFVVYPFSNFGYKS